MSDRGTLSQCMMDSDPHSTAGSRRLRRGAFAASLLLETLLVAAMLIWPLATPGVISLRCNLMPIVPFAGGKTPSPLRNHSRRQAPRNQRPIPVSNRTMFEPPRIPLRVDDSADHTPPAINETWGSRDPGDPNSGEQSFGARGGNGPGAAPLPPPATPRRISMGVMEASLVNRVDPVYPTPAKYMRLSGEVKIRATIGTDGAVKDCVVVSGPPLLGRAALDAVRQWRYRPTKLNGEPVEVETWITVNFVLQ